jgi:hypothetical protein
MTVQNEYEGLSSEEKLNHFRNKYYTDDNHIENGIISEALNELLPDYCRLKVMSRVLKDQLEADSRLIAALEKGLESATMHSASLKELLLHYWGNN